jgi:UPF0755 protein
MSRAAEVATTALLVVAFAAGAALYLRRDAVLAPDVDDGPMTGPEVQVTIPEGLRKEEVAALLAKAGVSTKDALLAAMEDRAVKRALDVPLDVPGGVDGYLFPDTYRFTTQATPRQVLKRMRKRLDDVIDAEMRARMKEMGWTLHEVLTLASIVEKETAQPDERPRISAVFHNRLQRHMRLQTDPTVVYGIADFDGDIDRADLRRDHPYNTYVHDGLPPGPIAQPGLAAIRAALWPAQTNDLYFVARGNTGAHEFCPDLECHNAAVRKWQVAFFRKKR